jgi:hypothetical protein
MNRSRLERLAKEFLPSTDDDPFAPLWHSQWLAGFCAAIDQDMGRPPRWRHHNAPYRHHRGELGIWIRRALADFQSARGRMPVAEEFRRWVDAARLASSPFAGMEAWTR